MNTKTDWDKYYRNPYKISSITRKITGSVLVNVIKKFLIKNQSLKIIELGGGNSSFYELFLKKFDIDEYHIVDNNKLSLGMLSSKKDLSEKVFMHDMDVLGVRNAFIEEADIVYSVGLIEHFDKADTKRVIESHFNMVKKGGLIVITFPTPTILYRTVRWIMELFGIWIFYDERPLKMEEVLGVSAGKVKVLFKKIIWPIILTQGLIVAVKNK